MEYQKKTKNLNKKATFLFIISLILLVSISTQVFALTFLWNPPQTLDSGGMVGTDTSLATVNGFPAISYFDATNYDLKFIHATNASGTNWAPAQTLDSVGVVGMYTSLAVINGFPAISYYDYGKSDLKFIRATNASGTSWDSAQTLDSGGGVGSYTSLAVINGFPAISYYDISNGYLKFIRATNASGTNWAPAQTLDRTGSAGSHTSLAVINGMPAISYYDIGTGDLKFVRATDASGTNWESPKILISAGDIGEYSSLAEINGLPAISYYSYSLGDLQFIRATGRNPDGSYIWDSPQTLDSGGNVGLYTSLAVINGMPAISYYDAAKDDLKFVHATDASGTNWGSPKILISAEDVGSYSSLAVINGMPAISYFDRTNEELKFISAHGSVDISVWDAAVQINAGETLDFGSTTLGTPVTTDLTIQNNGSVALNFDEISLPNGFSLTGTYPTEVASGASQDIHIRLDALQTGTFSGNLQISSADTKQSPFSITLEGIVTDTSGEIAMFDGLTGIADGETTPIDFGTTTLGTSVSRTFTIQNLGSNALDIYALTLPSGFSLQGTYNHVVAPSSSTTITIQLDASFVGSYAGEFSLVNDDTDENPFNFAISGQVNNTSLETGIIAPLNGSTVLESPLQVAFNHDVLHDGSAEAADNPVNYLLVEDGANGLFETATCLAGVAGDDVQQTINSVTYNASTLIATLNTDPLPAGHYQLLVCGTASIEDASGNVLNGGAFDSITTFTVVSGTGTGAGSVSAASLALLPATGFTPGTQTSLPTQPDSLAYNEMDSLTLQIPSLKVNIPIVGVPQTSNGWDVTWLTNAQAGWLNGTAYPTWDGNTVLTGHVTNASGNPGPFANIKTLKFGDQITIQAYGEEYTYEVRENKLVTRDNLSIIEEHKDRDWVTLITCEYFNENTGQYLFRRVIRAVLVEVE